MELIIRNTANQPIYEQICQQIKAQILNEKAIAVVRDSAEATAPEEEEKPKKTTKKTTKKAAKKDEEAPAEETTEAQAA